MKRWLTLSIILLTGIAGLYFLHGNYTSLNNSQQDQQLSQNANQIEVLLKDSLNDQLHHVQQLARFMLSQQDLPDFDAFDYYTQHILDNHPTVHGFGYVDTGLVIRHINPLKGREKAIGLDLMTRPAAPFVQMAVQERILTLNNPTMTVLGVYAVIARMPLYKDDKFLGLVQNLFDVNKILHGIEKKVDVNIKFTARDATGKYFWNSELILNSKRLIHFPIANTYWDIEVGWVSEPPGVDPVTLSIIWSAGGTIIVLILLLINQTMTRTLTLSKSVNTKTRQIDTVLRSIPDLVMIMSKEGYYRAIYTANDKALYAPKDILINKNIKDILPVHFANAVQQIIDKTIESGEDIQNYEYCLEIEGINFCFSARIVPFTYQDEKCVIWVARDVTQQKESENKLRQAEHQLIQSQKMDAIGRVAGSITHDFNNMLTTITLYTKLILQGIQKDNPIYVDVEGIQKASIQAATLTRQLLTFCYQQDLKLELINVNRLIHEMEKMLYSLLGESVQLDIQYCDEANPILADLNQIQQIIINMAINSRDAMPDGGKFSIRIQDKYLPEIDDTIINYMRPGSYTQITIEDNGTGIQKEYLDRVFEPFFSTKGKGKGTGLGLSTAYGIIKQCKGYIFVHSNPGKSTRFDIYFPASTIIPSIRETNTSKAALGGNETILLIDDDKSIMNLVSRILEQHGYKVLMAKDAKEAISISDHSGDDIQLLITDIMMPEMNGVELSKKIKEKCPDIQTIFITGHVHDDIFAQDDYANANKVLIEKPFDPETLLQKTRNILDKVV